MQRGERRGVWGRGEEKEGREEEGSGEGGRGEKKRKKKRKGKVGREKGANNTDIQEADERRRWRRVTNRGERERVVEERATVRESLSEAQYGEGDGKRRGGRGEEVFF